MKSRIMLNKHGAKGMEGFTEACRLSKLVFRSEVYDYCLQLPGTMLHDLIETIPMQRVFVYFGPNWELACAIESPIA